VQFDEKWAFVGRKGRNCEPDETTAGDCWDHVALGPESRLVVSLVVGKRTAEATHALVADFHQRTGGRIPWLMTSDEYPVYADAIRTAYGQVVTPPPTGRPGRPQNPTVVMPAGLTYATVHKHRQNGRVVRVSTTLVFGTWFGLLLALAMSAVSRVVNAAFVERHNGTDRGRCSRKVRKTAAFSKDWGVHVAVTRFSHFTYNFCWPVRTLRVKGANGRWQSRTPAMAAGLTDHVWTIREWITLPAVQRR
jgi:IS1 family transposase